MDKLSFQFTDRYYFTQPWQNHRPVETDKLPEFLGPILIVKPPGRPVDTPPVSRLVTVRTMVGVMALLAALDES